MKYLASSFLSILLLTLVSVTQTNGQQVIDKIIAKVDNYIILNSDVEAAYQQMKASNEPIPPNAKCGILEQLVINKVLLAKAEIDSVIVDEVQILSEMERRMQYFVAQFGSEQKLEQTLGTTVGELKEDLRDKIHEQLTVQRMKNEVLSKAKVTPAEIRSYFNSIPKDSIPYLPTEVQVGQIVLNPEVSKSQKDEVKQKLYDFKQRILSGEDFASLAKKYSEDYGSASKGGDLGWHGRGELVPEFEATALQIDEGEIADPIESEFGFHLIELLERRGNRFRARHILLRPKSNDADVKLATQKLDSIRNLILIDSIGFEKAAQEHSNDQATRASAGYFTSQESGSLFIPTNVLDPVVYFTVDTMSVGKITPPMEYRTEDGKKAVRIIFFKEKKPSHYANLKDDYQKLYAATLNDRKNDLLMSWLKKSKGEVFINIDPDYQNCTIMENL